MFRRRCAFPACHPFMYMFHWEIFLDRQVADLLLHGAAVTCGLAVLSSLLALAAGMFLAAGRASRNVLFRRACSIYCDAVRSIPGVFWLILLFFCLPLLVPHAAGAVLCAWDGFPFWAAAAGLAIGGSPYFSDILYSIASEEDEALAAARLSGLKGVDFWFFVAFPSAFLLGFPALSMRLLHQLKNTSLAMVVSVPELTWASQEIESLSFAGLEAATAATVLYIGIGSAAAFLLARAEKALQGRFPLGAGRD